MPPVLTCFYHVKVVEQGNKDMTSHLVFEALLHHPPHPVNRGLVSLHSSMERAHNFS